MLPEFIGKFQVKSILGEGGMGIVYLGHDAVLGRNVAIKMIRIDLVSGTQTDAQADYLARFIQEARLCAKLNHPNIATIFEFGETADGPFMVFEYIDGLPLNKYFENKENFNLNQVIDILEQLAAGLDHAHKYGVIHRDIKPANLFINKLGNAKILDFGIAKAEESQLTVGHQFLGTPIYCSPEQACGTEIVAGSDTFSFGIVCHELLTGRRPFEGENAVQVLNKIATGRPNLFPLRPELGKDVDMSQLFLQVFERDPLARMSSPGTFVASLRFQLLNADTASTVIIDASKERQASKESGPGTEIMPRPNGAMGQTMFSAKTVSNQELNAKPLEKTISNQGLDPTSPGARIPVEHPPATVVSLDQPLSSYEQPTSSTHGASMSPRRPQRTAGARAIPFALIGAALIGAALIFLFLQRVSHPPTPVETKTESSAAPVQEPPDQTPITQSVSPGSAPLVPSSPRPATPEDPTIAALKYQHRNLQRDVAQFKQQKKVRLLKSISDECNRILTNLESMNKDWDTCTIENSSIYKERLDKINESFLKVQEDVQERERRTRERLQKEI